MLNKVYPFSGKIHINSLKYSKTPAKSYSYSRAFRPKVIIPAITSAVLLSVAGFGALLLKRIIDNTKPPKK